MDLLMLAQEGHGGGLDLVGQLRGYGVAIFAVGLFCGSIYLLLATDVGGRLGFMVAFSALTGFLTLLAMIWFTNFTPLNALHGPPPTWKVKEVVDDPKDARIKNVRQIEDKGVKLSEAEQGEIKASVDSAVTAENSPYLLYATINEYVVLNAERIGGGKSGPLGLKHKPLHGVMKIQGVKKVEPVPGQAPPPPEADPAAPAHYVVLERDLGALRQPPLFMVMGFGILFVISLVVMHNGERARQMEERKGELEPVPTPESAPEPAPSPA
ncbi:MAG TPA: hypothetical protein VGL92_07170 [Acidimicrobiia bacterium]|jgi:hypothetical protein